MSVRLRSLILLFFPLAICFNATGQVRKDRLMPVRAFAIASPAIAVVDSFIAFINNELAPRNVNTLILRIDFNYQFKSHPELVDSGALSAYHVKSLVQACKKNNIRIIPQINLLGHQSWANRTGKLLQVYPQFDETPGVLIPSNYKWPNADSLYCKSYCPLHPDVHRVVFDLVDEICDVFEADAFHAGLDEVFYIADDKCPRCRGKSKAALFAGEVTKIYNHLAQTKKELWIWGDRLLNANTMELGMWEGSNNNTYAAIDMVPRDVVICDWHYDRAVKTAELFAAKGFRVITCSWKKPDVAITQVNDMVALRQLAGPQLKTRYLGMMETVWTSVRNFLNGYYASQTLTSPQNNTTEWDCFKAMYTQINKLAERR